MADERELIDIATGKSVGVENIGRFRQNLRAIYTLDVDKHENKLEITPLGLYTPELYTTRIGLTETRAVHCRLEMIR
jgi:hypothetical protein